MKIGIDARLWNETGVGRYIRNLIGNLHEIDHKNEYVLFCRSSDVSGIKYKVLSLQYKIVTTDIRWHSVDEQFRFPQILYKENLDLMHFPYFSIPVLYNRPFVITVHDLIIHHFPTGQASTLPLPLYKLKHAGYRAVLRNAVNKAQKIIVPSNAVKDDLVKSLSVPPGKIIMTYEGVDESISNVKYQPRLSRDQITNDKWKNEKYFLYVGNAYPHKNLERLIYAFSNLQRHPEQSEGSKILRGVYPEGTRRAQNDFQLLLVGKEDYFYNQLEKRLIIESITNVQILHNIVDSELHQLYKNAIAVISPSLIEGFGLVPLEAMANHCLVVASDIPAHREICKDAAIYFNSNSIDDLANILKQVCYYDSNHRDKYNKAGAERVKLFSWRKMAEETLQLYEQFNK